MLEKERQMEYGKNKTRKIEKKVLRKGWRYVSKRKCKRKHIFDVHDSGSRGGPGWSHWDQEQAETVTRRKGCSHGEEVARRRVVGSVSGCKNSGEAKREWQRWSILRIMKINPSM